MDPDHYSLLSQHTFCNLVLHKTACSITRHTLNSSWVSAYVLYTQPLPRGA